MPTTHAITLNSPWYEYVRNSEKPYEGRCNYRDYVTFKVGDWLEITHSSDQTLPAYRVIIGEILKFANFEEALRAVPFKLVLPSVATVEEGVEIYKRIYPMEVQQQYGALLFKVEMVEPQ